MLERLKGSDFLFGMSLKPYRSAGVLRYIMKESLSELEHLVLLAVMRLGDSAYGLSVQGELLETARRRTTRAAVYVALRRLDETGYLDSTATAPIAVRGGRSRRNYSLSEQGLRALRSQQSTLSRMWSGFEEQIES